jgi:hypothetical protein
MSFIYGYLLAMLVLVGGNRNRNDLLDAVAADIYWQLKGVTPSLAQLEKDADADAAPADLQDVVKRLQSDDFQTRDKARQELERMGPAIIDPLKQLAKSPDTEVAAVAADLLKRFSEHAKERSIRRLMAIRTLGERHEKDALPLLKSLEKSEELFVAEYARRAEAQINGEAVVLPDSAARMERDLALFPADTALIGQCRGVAPGQLTIASLVERIIAVEALRVADEGAPAVRPDRKQWQQEATRKVLSLIERVGNLQIDGVTFGFTFRKNNDGWAAVVIHGKYDAGLFFSATRELLGPNEKATPAAAPGDVPSIVVDDGAFVILFPDNERLVLLTTMDNKPADLVTKFIASLKTGKGGFAENKEMAALMKTIDTRSPAWMAACLTEAMSTDVFAGFKTVTLDSTPIKDGAAFTFKAAGDDAGAVLAAAQRMETSIKNTIPGLQGQVLRNPEMKPVLDLMTSFKVVSGGQNAALTGEISSQMLNAMLGELGLGRALVQPAVPQDVIDPVPPELNK